MPDYEVTAIRRLRRTPFTHAQNAWLIYHQLQIEMETGVGLQPGNQGDDPQIMVQWSNDRGKTYGNEHWVSAGRIGRYRARAIVRRLGRARSRVFDVVVTEPVRISLIDAYIEVTPGA